MTNKKILFDYIVLYSNRRTVSISISDRGDVVVRAPKKYKKEQITNILNSKNDWITKHQNKVFLKQQSLNNLSSNQQIYYLGIPCKLTVSNDAINSVNREREQINIACKSVKHPFDVMRKWFINEAKKTIEPLVIKYCSLLNVSYEKLKITNAKTRWGSCCKGRKSLCFTWRLMMAPIEVINYVILHEVAHLKVPDHSKLFWNEVASLMPEFKKHKLWLKDNGFLIKIDESTLNISGK